MANITTNTLKIGDNNLILRDADAQARITTLEADTSTLKEDLTDVLNASYNPVDSSKITVSRNGRYIGFNGVQGTALWSQLYQFDTELGRIYYIHSKVSRAVPVLYFSGVAYPSSAQQADYEASYTIVGDGTKAYINAFAVDKVVEQQPIISENRYLPVTDTLENATKELEKIKTDVVTTVRSGYYINSSGVQGTLTGYNVRSFVSEKGKIYFIKTKIARAQAVSGIIPLVYSNGTNYGLSTQEDIIIIQGNSKTVYVNTYADYDYAIKEYVFEYTRKPLFLEMFNDIVCCGDSLTYGLVYTSSTTTRQANSPYPETLAKLTGCNVAKIATAGYKTSDWWKAYNEQITGRNKLYLIYLGTNAALTDTVDTDCVGDDYTQYAETETGYYGRIVQKIKDTGSYCIIIKVAKGTSATSNPSLINIAQRFDVPIVDNPATGSDSPLENMYYHYGDDETYYNTVHMNDLGYAVFAEMLLNNIKELPLADQYKIMPR